MPPRRGPPRRKDAIATRARLVRAALELFTTDGYRGTTTAEIADRARTAEATIYRHFRGKDELYHAALAEALQVGIALVREGEGPRGPGCRERLRHLGRRLAERAAADPPMVMMLLRRGTGPSLDEAGLQLTREFRDAVAQVIATGKQQGTVRPGSADLWSAVWLALMGFVVERIAARDWSPEHPGVGLTLDAAWDAIAYREGSPAGAPG